MDSASTRQLQQFLAWPGVSRGTGSTLAASMKKVLQTEVVQDTDAIAIAAAYAQGRDRHHFQTKLRSAVAGMWRSDATVVGRCCVGAHSADKHHAQSDSTTKTNDSSVEEDTVVNERVKVAILVPSTTRGAYLYHEADTLQPVSYTHLTLPTKRIV